MVTERHNVACRLILKSISKNIWQVVRSIWIPAALIDWPNKTFELLSMLMIGHYPAGFSKLAYLPEIDSLTKAY